MNWLNVKTNVLMKQFGREKMNQNFDKFKDDKKDKLPKIYKSV